LRYKPFHMEWWQAFVLGVVEGVTEFLPVSSTGHLLLTQRLLGMPSTEASNAYAVCIQLGAILAVLGIFRARIASMVNGVLGRDPAGRRLALHVIVAFLPAAVIGKLLNDPIERVLFGLWPVAAAWFVGGLVILALAKRHRPGGDGFGLDALTPTRALVIGLAQCVALWPGTSRSLATIVGALLLGMEMSAAVEFSFLLGLVTLSAAAGYKGLKSGAAIRAAYGPAELAVGFAMAAASAFLAVRWMVSWLQRRGLAVFGWYRIALAIVVVVLLRAGLVRAS
jgi:undecaprenyl-diphosphatase